MTFFDESRDCMAKIVIVIGNSIVDYDYGYDYTDCVILSSKLCCV